MLLYLGVDTQMSLKSWILGKLSITENASKWLDTCVCSSMTNKGTTLCEEGTTFLTLEVLFSCMKSHVNL
jgi:hypothetical protein